MKLLKMALLAGLLVSCTEFRGNLSVNSELTLKSKDETLTLAEGTYRARINFLSKKKMKIEVGGQKLKVKFDDKFRLPSNGDFFLSKDETSLNYDLAGTIETEVERGEVRFHTEFCDVMIPVTRCHRRICHTDYHRVPGFRNIEYRDDIISRVFKIDFADAGQTASTFDATSVDQKRVYLYQGACLARRF